MSTTINFTKMQSLGNDFMLIDNNENPGYKISEQEIKQLSCRRTGIGFDQLLTLEYLSDEDIFQFTIANADGSKAKQCINGLRSVAKYIFCKYENLKDITIKNESGIYTVFQLESGKIISYIDKKMIKKPTKSTIKENISPYSINIGNNHTVFRTRNIREIDLSNTAKIIYNNIREESNISAYEIVKPGHVKSRTLEIGSGETLACGSGAIAIAVAYAEETGINKVIVEQCGGTQNITIEKNMIAITANAATVFSGKINLPFCHNNYLNSIDT
jgi:diaminopimelate epimerase